MLPINAYGIMALLRLDKHHLKNRIFQQGDFVVDRCKKEARRYFAPIIAHKGWEDMVTEDMKLKAQIERLANPSKDLATDYEAMIYLHTASLATPLGDLESVYSYLFSKYYPNQAREIGVYKDKINDREERELTKLKKWIYGKQNKNI